MRGHDAQAPRCIAAAAPSGGPRLYPSGRRSSGMERAPGDDALPVTGAGLVVVCEDPAAMTVLTKQARGTQ